MAAERSLDARVVRARGAGRRCWRGSGAGTGLSARAEQGRERHSSTLYSLRGYPRAERGSMLGTSLCRWGYPRARSGADAEPLRGAAGGVIRARRAREARLGVPLYAAGGGLSARAEPGARGAWQARPATGLSACARKRGRDRAERSRRIWLAAWMREGYPARARAGGAGTASRSDRRPGVIRARAERSSHPSVSLDLQ